MIVKMSKLSIAGLMSERSAVVRRLMKIGAVELSEVSMSAQERERALGIASFDNAEKRIADIDGELRKIQEAIAFLTAAARECPSASGGKRPSAALSFDRFVDSSAYAGIWEKVFEVNGLHKRVTAKKTELNALKNDAAFLTVWENLQTPAALAGTETTAFLTGAVPRGAEAALLERLGETGLAVADTVSADKEQTRLFIAFHRSAEAAVAEILQESGFSRVSFGGRQGTVAENIAEVRGKIQIAAREIAELTKVSAGKYAWLPEIERLYDYIYNMRERRKARGNFLKTETAFLVGGWTPADCAERVKREIEGEFTARVAVTPPEEGEEPPVLLRNGKLVYPFEMITEMYSLPAPGGMDPNAAMSPFYWLFFGLMLSDAGYGVLLTLFCALALWRLKPERGAMMDKMLKMLAFGGVSTVLWGAAFGGWFGDLSAQVFGKAVSPLWFDPNSDPTRLLIWSFILGAVHLFAGMGLNAYLMIRDGKWLDALFDVGLWYAALIGAAMLLLGGKFAEVGKYTAMIAAAGLVLTQGRAEKGILKKLMTGVLSLYNITGYISDVLSYSRLLALGLATGVIAQVINQLAVLPGGLKNAFTVTALIIILLGGHLFNLAINTLGAYVHASRLQYVEFFGKFYQGGGRAFAPLRAKLKYLKLQ
ncbi:MAG: V-type ATP synthase subunit I [Clostridiales bacterium]|jgi:V/A-type H+-transporting ATPase subunit I|nr:V-type ATP synthase subunit I [Clostridiales bacterium]